MDKGIIDSCPIDSVRIIIYLNLRGLIFRLPKHKGIYIMGQMKRLWEHMRERSETSMGFKDLKIGDIVRVLDSNQESLIDQIEDQLFHVTDTNFGIAGALLIERIGNRKASWIIEDNGQTELALIQRS